MRNLIARLTTFLRAAAAAVTASPVLRAAAVTLVVAGAAVWLLPHEALLAAPLLGMAVLLEPVHAGEFLAWEASAFLRESITVLSGQNLNPGAVVGRVAFGVGRASVPAVVGTGNGTMSNVFVGPEVERGNYVVTLITAIANGGVFSVVTPSGKRLADLTLTVGAGGTTLYRSRHLNFSIADGSTDFVPADAFTVVVGTTAPTVVGTGSGTVAALALGPDVQAGLYQLRCILAAANSGTFELLSPDGTSLGQRTIPAGAGNAVTFADNRQLVVTVTDGATDFAAGDVFNIAVFNELGGGKVVAWDPTVNDGRQRAAGVLLADADATVGDLAGVIIGRDAVVVKSALQWGALISEAQKDSAYRDLAARGVLARDGVV